MKLIRSGEEVRAFWAELKPCDHLVEMYETDRDFLDSLEGFARDGLAQGDSIILIATPEHLKALARRLAKSGMELDAARQQDRYIELDAEETLATFVVDGWPDEERFRRVIGGVLRRATAAGREVRAFGEMVAFLWARNRYAATVSLEHLWHRFCAEEGFSLLCAYPVSGPTDRIGRSMREICQAHSHVITKSGVAPA